MTHWLIDGHNLIGQLQDLSLDDPYDEAKLTMAIKRYCMRGKFKATVIFDNGLPGGVSRELSNSDVTVIFAPPRTSADHLLMRRARDMYGTPGLVLVTSDERIARLAFAYSLETMASEEFAILIGFRPVDVPDETPPDKAAPPAVVFDKDPNPRVTQEEVAYWLPIFQRRLHIARAARAAADLAAREAARVAAERRREQERKEREARIARTTKGKGHKPPR